MLKTHRQRREDDSELDVALSGPVENPPGEALGSEGSVPVDLVEGAPCEHNLAMAVGRVQYLLEDERDIVFDAIEGADLRWKVEE